jgi:F-type H+-transporting ATPase subunit delta
VATASLTALCRRYAKAIHALAEQSRETDAVQRDLAALSQAASQHAEVRTFLESPLLSRAQKETALMAVLARGGASPLTHRILRTLARAGRLAALPGIAQAYDARVAKARGSVEVTVESARPLAQEAQVQLASALSARYGDVRLRVRENPALIGGMILIIGDLRMDYSVSGQMARLRSCTRAGRGDGGV